MNISKFLAKVIGIYLLIISVAMLINMHQFTNNINTLIRDVPVMLVIGFFTLILGILMVVAHNIWQLNWRVIITIIGWITLLKGGSIIFYLHFIDWITNLYLQSTVFAYVGAAIDFILGVVLIYFGFRKI